MPPPRSKFLVSLFLVLFAAPGYAQRNLAGAGEARLALERLGVVGSVMMIGAHPDDENTALLAYYARGRKIRTAYLSLTRGEGGQNLVGPEQGDLLGLIRTQELLAARRIDGAEQLFTRAIDFGFSKTAEETLEKWGREAVLSDIVWDIRRFRPDVIVLRFSGTPRDGHGQHQASAILGKEAFFAAADKARFPEQLKYVEPWQAKRIVWNAFSFNREQEREAEKLPARVEIDLGEYDPLLGYSYSEIAGMSRSMHRSQGMGAPERRGPAKNFFTHVAGDPAKKDIFDGVDTTWNRIPGGAEAGRLIADALAAFQAGQPWKSIPALMKARLLIAPMRDPWAVEKLRELDEAVALCAGLWLDASADRWNAVPGTGMTIRATAINRSPQRILLKDLAVEGSAEAKAGELPATLANNQPETRELRWTFSPDAPYSQPFWLREAPQGDLYTIPDQRQIGIPEGPALLRARFRLEIEAQTVELVRPVHFRHVDRVEGEKTRPLAVVPQVALDLSEKVRMFPDAQPRNVEVTLRAEAPGQSGEVRLEAPRGWRVQPESRHFEAADAGQEVSLRFQVSPPESAGRARLRAVARAGDREIASGLRVIDYSYIPPIAVFPPAGADLVRADIRVLAKNIGYVMGAGDNVPDALRQIGCDVTLLSAHDLATGDLRRFDAIVTGVRAYNVRADLRANQHRLLEYVKNGGTMLVEYNVLDFATDPSVLNKLGPYPLRIGRDRVTVEEAPVTFPDPGSPLLREPNRITPADFDGWIQERGLYFASEWDPQYKSLFESHDPGESPHPGGTLYARYGQGVYIFSAYSWFRELPAGVPGAFRIFANLLSAGKTLK